jgi:hypothetical protein
MARAIEEKNESLVSIALAEERKKAAQKEAERAKEQKKVAEQDTPPVAPRPHGRLFLVVLLVVLLGAVGALGVVFVKVLPSLKIELPDISLPSFGGPDATPVTTDPSPVAPVILVPSLIPAQSEKNINITGKSSESIFTEVVDEYARGVEKGMVKNIYFTKEVSDEERGMVSESVSSKRLLATLDFQVPEILTRTLEDDFMMGFLGEEKGTTPFLVLKVAIHDTGLAGILLWEKKLPYFFDKAFGVVMSTTATSPVVFRDVVIEGRDARTGEVGGAKGISYIFADENTLIIAGSQSALRELLVKYGGHAE